MCTAWNSAYYRMPLSHLNENVKWIIANGLDQHCNLEVNGLTQNWIGLGKLMGFRASGFY